MPQSALAQPTQIQTGTFSLVTEAGWGAGFELKKDGTAVVIPSFDSEGDDEKEEATGVRPELKKIPAQWKRTKDGIEISYLKQRDQFKLDNHCKNWKEYPCFRFQKSLAGNESLLNFKQPYINWEWKHSSHSSEKPDQKQCLAECKKMKKDKTLKAGTSIDECVKTICK